MPTAATSVRRFPGAINDVIYLYPIISLRISLLNKKYHIFNSHEHKLLYYICHAGLISK